METGVLHGGAGLLNGTPATDCCFDSIVLTGWLCLKGVFCTNIRSIPQVAEGVGKSTRQVCNASDQGRASNHGMKSIPRNQA